VETVGGECANQEENLNFLIVTTLTYFFSLTWDGT